MIGLALGKVIIIDANNQKIEIKNVTDIRLAQGSTKLAYIVAFNLLSEYNPEFGTGSNFLQLMRDLIVLVGQPEQSSLAISEELDNVRNRIIYHQKNSVNYNLIPANERLSDLNILSINIDDENREIESKIEIIDEAGNLCYFDYRST